MYLGGKMYQILQGDCLERLDELDENSVDCIITDPPYGLTSITKRFGKKGSAPAKYGKDGSFSRLSKGFMGKEWDGSGIEYNVDMWEKCLRVLKPGGYLLAFGGTRTYHRITCAIEDAGFEIRDCIMWLYGSGFPKSMNIGLAIDKKNGVESPVIGQNEQILKKQAKDLREGKRKIVDSFNNGAPERNNGFNTVSADIKQAQNEWSGWGTCLKPAFEPIIMARKPFKGSLINNVLENHVGGLNIDECRVPYEDTPNPATNPLYRQENKDRYKQVEGGRLSEGAVAWTSGKNGVNAGGRYPANLVLTYDDTDYDEVCAGFPQSKGGSGKGFKKEDYEEKGVATNFKRGDFVPYNDSGSASRYFYCAKASSRDRDEGLNELEAKQMYDGKNASWGYGNANGDNFGDRIANVKRRNTHPTVKPTALMQYLVRLVAPKGATILDPFMGSGSTGKAVAYENKDRDMNYKFIGIEKDAEYCDIAKRRIDYVNENM